MFNKKEKRKQGYNIENHKASHTHLRHEEIHERKHYQHKQQICFGRVSFVYGDKKKKQRKKCGC